MPGVQMTRLAAVHACPVRPKALAATMRAAVAGSASSRTTIGFLPPISSWTRARRAPAAAWIASPTGTDPVNEIAATRGSVTSASPATAPRPWTMLSTPAGRPASVRAVARCQVETGVSSDGLRTTALALTSAGASFQAGMAIGKFHGVISPTTPRDSRVV